ncbi:hypothetical protein ACQEV4_42725 [Streptomyces shenzhenensis]|uniref:hypothetical protein n=1 Tax=Streptomyces shenzhenensis TaxID=943815 RepID=UPI003D8B3889
MTGPQPELERPAAHIREAQQLIEQGRAGAPATIAHALLAIAGELRELNHALKKRR